MDVPRSKPSFFLQILIFCELLVSFQPLGPLDVALERLLWKAVPKIALQGAIPPFVPGFIGNSGLGSAVAWARGAGQGFAGPQRGFFLSFRVEQLLQNPV